MRILITGASGQLGGYLLHALASTDHQVTAWSGKQTGSLFGVDLLPVDLARESEIAAAFQIARPEAIVHAAALSSVGLCYREPEPAERVNARGTKCLVDHARRAQARMVYVSTDLVFDGEHAPYDESSDPAPLSTYGQSKAAAEPSVLSYENGTVARMSLLFGSTLVSRPSFFDQQVAALRQGDALPLFHDETRTPLDYLTAARALIALAEHGQSGLLHIGGPERMSRLDMGRRIGSYFDLDLASIVRTSRTAMDSPERRPRDTSLDSGRWRALFPQLAWPPLEEALGEHRAEFRAGP